MGVAMTDATGLLWAWPDWCRWGWEGRVLAVVGVARLVGGKFNGRGHVVMGVVSADRPGAVGVVGSVGATDGFGRGLENVAGLLWAWPVW